MLHKKIISLLTILICSFFLFTSSLFCAYEVNIKADSLTYQQDDEILNASGNVELEWTGKIIKADNIEMHIKDQHLAAEGNVEISEEKSLLLSDKVQYDMDKEHGDLEKTFGTSSSIFFKAEKMVKVSSDTYEIENVKLSNCDLDDPHHYAFAKRGIFIVDKKITIYKAKAYDVLSYVESLNVTMTDSNGNYILNKADASVDHKVTLNKYGNYRIEYNSKDGNGRTSNRSFTICCIENEKPTLTIDFTLQEQYAVGSVLSLPTYSFNDNSLNCTLDVCLYLPSGQGIALEHATMRDGSIYKENYLDLDHYSNQLVQSNHEVKLYIAGKYRLRYLVVDAYGNVNLKEFVLKVG